MTRKYHILHVLFTRARGGLEQAFLDYTNALVSKGHQVTAVVTPQAPYIQALKDAGATIIKVDARGFYDIRAMWRLRSLCQRLHPDAVLAHNARAIALSSYVTVPLIGVSHSYKTARILGARRLFVLTEHMKAHTVRAGYPEDRCFVMLNMINLNKQKLWSFWPKHRPPVIGTVSRLMADKGIDTLLRAIAILRKDGIELRARIASEGEFLPTLKSLAEYLKITDLVEFTGWLEDKKAFLDTLDILTIPSLHEPFGLVVLEAWNHGIPLIASDAEGPSALVSHGKNGLLFKKGDEKDFAEKLKELLTGKSAESLVAGGYEEVKRYSMDAGAERLEGYLRSILNG